MKVGDKVKIIGRSVGGRVGDIGEVAYIEMIDDDGDCWLNIGGGYDINSLIKIELIKN